MNALVFLLDFPYIHQFLAGYNDYYKVVIVDRKRKIDITVLHRHYDRILIVSDIQRRDEVEKAFAGILETKQVRAVYGTYEAVVELAGYLRGKFNIPGMNYTETLQVRNKYIMKQTALKHGIATAKCKLAKSLVDVCAFIKENRYPIIIKPVSGFGTRCTYRVNTFKDFFFFRVIKMLVRHREFIVENFIDGEEYHCDSVVLNGKVMFASVGKNLFNNLDTVRNGKPKGSIAFPAYCDSDEIIREIKHFNERLICCYDIKNAVCHMEVFVTREGKIYLGEIAARIGGSPCIGACIKNTRGLNMNKAFIDVAINNYDAEDVNDRPVFTGYLAFPSKAGQLVDISTEKDFSHLDGIKEITFLNKPGDRLMTQSSSSVRTGYIIIEDTDYERLKEKLFDAFASFKLTVK